MVYMGIYIYLPYVVYMCLKITNTYSNKNGIIYIFWQKTLITTIYQHIICKNQHTNNWRWTLNDITNWSEVAILLGKENPPRGHLHF